MVEHEETMGRYPKWQYDEMRQIGTDYEDQAEIEAYNQRMMKLRDVRGDIQKILDLLKLESGQFAMDIGTGTGELTMAMAEKCSKVYAIDISRQMLDYAEKKAWARGLKNIEFHQAGFLTYEHKDPLLDAVTSQLVLHHLPDFWKQVALLRISEMLKPGGMLYLEDAVYSFKPEGWESFFAGFVDAISRSAGDDVANDVVLHISAEHSTFSWILEGMIVRAGFKIDAVDYKDGFRATYLCTKI